MYLSRQTRVEPAICVLRRARSIRLPWLHCWRAISTTGQISIGCPHFWGLLVRDGLTQLGSLVAKGQQVLDSRSQVTEYNCQELWV
jgi:hypothetical protein